MTQEEKDLLLKDLCARLPYGVIIHHDDYFDPKYPRPNEVLTINSLAQYAEEIERWNVKPYLRSMSSMTNREKKDLDRTFYPCGEYDTNTYETFDWYNAHHFDYRGLIPKGLAIEAPEEMYK